MSASAIATDHPGWADVGGVAARAIEHDGVAWLVDVTERGHTLRPLEPTTGAPPPLAPTPATALPDNPDAAELLDALARLGTVLRLPNPSLWDAITTAILRQVVRAGQARVIYRRWCRTHGRTFDTPLGRHALPPSPRAVTELGADAFTHSGTTFHRANLQAAAHAYLDRHDEWIQLAPHELVKALDAVPGIGPWTASAAAADFSGDFAVYPHGDLAVRTWAHRAAPSLPFPGKERGFAAHWRRITRSRTELHALTLFTLTWGSHARTQRAHI